MCGDSFCHGGVLAETHYELDSRCLARMGRIVERMAKRKPKSQPTWTDVKTKLVEFDRAALLGLIQSLYAAHTKRIRRSFMPDLAWLRTYWRPTRKPLIDGFGLMCSGGKTLRSPQPSVPSLITKRRLAIRRDWQSWWFSTASVPLGFPETLPVTMRHTSMRWCGCSSRPSRPQTDYLRSAATS